MDGQQNSSCLGTRQHPWDVVVIGAGPAGGLAATLLARQGLRILLIERKKFPRDKVCGGCLSPDGVALLKQLSLNTVLTNSYAVPIEQLELRGQRRQFVTSMTGGAAILRSCFDEELAKVAIQSGAHLWMETTATITDGFDDGLRRIDLKSAQNSKQHIYARVVLACDGLGNNCVARLPKFRQIASRFARIGVGGLLEVSDSGLPAGLLSMAIGKHGYVGRIKLGDGRVSLAAALNPIAVRQLGASAAVFSVLEQCQVANATRYGDCELRGTLPLTRRAACIADEGIFLVGDSAGYVEPFTGEGMTLAMQAAEAVIPLVMTAQSGWHPNIARKWHHIFHHLTDPRHALCRGLSVLCRQPWLVNTGLSVAWHAPRLLSTLVSSIHPAPQRMRNENTWDFTSSV